MTTSKQTGLRRTELPAVERVRFQDAAASRAWESMRQVLDTRFGKGGSKLDKSVTWGDLVEAGIANMRLPNGKLIAVTDGDGTFMPSAPPVIDGIPPAPTGLTVSPGLATVFLQWDKPEFNYFGYAEIFRSTSNNQSTAVSIGQTTSWMYSDPVGSAGETFYYWVRFVSVGGKPGPFNSVEGESGNVSLDPTYLIDVLSADNPNALLWKVDQPTVINGVECPPGVYIRDLYLANGIIGRAQIGLAAIDDARISSLSAAKVTFGEMSGDRIAVNSLNADRLTVASLSARLATITDAYIKTANIQDAAITNAKIESLNASKITAGFISVDRLSPGVITSSKFSTWLESDAKNPDGVSILRLNFRTGEIQINARQSDGSYVRLNNRGMFCYDGNNVLRLEVGFLL